MAAAAASDMGINMRNCTFTVKSRLEQNGKTDAGDKIEKGQQEKNSGLTKIFCDDDTLDLTLPSDTLLSTDSEGEKKLLEDLSENKFPGHRFRDTRKKGAWRKYFTNDDPLNKLVRRLRFSFRFFS